MFEDARRIARDVDSNLLNQQAQPESLIIANAGARLIRHHPARKPVSTKRCPSSGKPLAWGIDDSVSC
jgi:hypothetical protein